MSLSFLDSYEDKNNKHVQIEYQVDKRIGDGRFGRVYRVETSNLKSEDNNDASTKNTYAIKAMDIYNDVIDENAEWEITLMEHLNHSNVMYLESWFIDSSKSNCDNILNEKTLCLVMPLFEYDLYEILINFAPLDISFIKCILYQVLSGLSYLHDEKCIIHRDLTPVNILVNLTNKHCVIADFGRAKDISHLFCHQDKNDNKNNNNNGNNNNSGEKPMLSDNVNVEEGKTVNENESDKKSNHENDNVNDDGNDNGNDNGDESEEEEDIDIEVNNNGNSHNTDTNGDGKTIESNENRHENDVENKHNDENNSEFDNEKKTEYQNEYKNNSFDNNSDNNNQDCSKFTGQMYPTRYRAPELLLGSREYDFAIDIWALGCIFGQMCFAKGESIVGCDTDFGQLFGLFDKLGGPQGLEGVGLFDEFCFDTKPLTKMDQLVPYLADDENACHLLSQMLTYNPKQRITAMDAWNHSFLDDQWLQDGTFNENVTISQSQQQDTVHDNQIGATQQQPNRLFQNKHDNEDDSNEDDDDEDDDDLDY